MVSRHVVGMVILAMTVTQFGDVKSARILGVCPRAAVSHQVVFRGLMLALHNRGHEIVTVTSDPLRDPSLKNYTEIDVNFLYKSNVKTILEDAPWLQTFPNLGRMINVQTEEVLNHPEFQRVYEPRSNETFDLIIVHLIYWPAFFPLATRFNAPIIGICPMGLPVNLQYSFGNPILTSHPSNWDLYGQRTGTPSFWERLSNFVDFWLFLHHYETVYVQEQAKIARKYFGDDIHDLSEMAKNVSLVFVNQQGPISYVKPNVPKIIEINGLHMQKEMKPLPERLRKILDEADRGFVYMSLGSNMKSNMLSNETRSTFVTAFSKLPYTVIWKFEDEVLPGKPDNVHIMKWLPQQAVLAHPNLKVFVYQGGLQSTEEAVTYGVPLVGIPVWADQRMQVDKMVELGVARKLDLRTLNQKIVEETIHAVAFDKRYKEEMLKLSVLLKENAADLLDNAMWWTEHVIRHKGAPYLQSSTADDPWYRRMDMDLVAFVAMVATLASCFIIFISYRLLIVGVKAYMALLAHRRKKNL